MMINSRELFADSVQDFSVSTTELGKVRYVNLDNAATTPPFRAVQQAVDKFINSYGSVHRGAGTKSKLSTDIYDRSREAIKKFVNAPADRYVLFTGNTTGAMNTAAHYFSFLSGKIAVSDMEHSSSWLPWIKAEGIRQLDAQVALTQMDEVNDDIQRQGRRQVVRYSVNDEFEFDLSAIERLLQEEDIKAFVLTASSNATGYCPNIKVIGELVHKYGAYFVVDACQFMQHHPIDMRELGIDFLAASGHKIYAPYGEGFLVGPKQFFDHFISYQIGGGNLPYITREGEFLRHPNQLAHDPGTPNAVGAVAVMAALEQLEQLGLDNVERHEHALTKRAYNGLKDNPAIQLLVSECHLNTVIPFTVKGWRHDEFAEKLNRDFGIGVRAGSFCVYNMVRRLLQITDESDIVSSVRAGQTDKIPGFIRASFSLCNQEEDVDRFLLAVNKLTDNHHE